MPPLQSLTNNKTLLTSGTPIDIWLLDDPKDGEWWKGKGFIDGGNYTFRSDYTWNERPGRKRKLGSVNPWMGMNNYVRFV